MLTVIIIFDLPHHANITICSFQIGCWSYKNKLLEHIILCSASCRPLSGENEWKFLCLCLHSCFMERSHNRCVLVGGYILFFFFLIQIHFFFCLCRYFALSSQRPESLRTSLQASSPTSPPSTASTTSSCSLSSKHVSLENGEE